MAGKESLPEPLEACLRKHLDTVKVAIASRARELASSASSADSAATEPPVSIVHLSQAIREYAPGEMLPAPYSSKPDKLGFLDYFPPFTLMCAGLAFAFGVFGIIALARNGAVKDLGGGFVDIAKVFAGAIVGSTSAIALGTSARRRRNTP